MQKERKIVGAALAAKRKIVGAALAAILLLPAASLADTMDDEIDYIISSVGRGGCKFIRNGTQYSGKDARAHLKSKRRHNAHLFDSTEEFIEKIVSKSAISGEPYLISCRARGKQTAAEWFTALLVEYRGGAG